MKEKGIIVLVEILMGLLISCEHNPTSSYPTPIQISDVGTRKVEALNPVFYSVIDLSRMKTYSIGEYVIFQSILFGPLGRSSNYNHYLLTDKGYSKQVYFMSISSAINNIWTSNDTVFVDLLDFDEETYYNETWLDDDSCKYILHHLFLSEPSFFLDTITREEVFLRLEETYIYQSCTDNH